MGTRRSRSRVEAAPTDQVVEPDHSRRDTLTPILHGRRRESALSEAQVDALETVLQTSSWAVDHVRHVRETSRWIFDGLREYHGLGAVELSLLEAGALLHDVGYPIDPADHHKVSARIIRALLGSPFTRDQVHMIALLARYHRKGVPQLEQRRYAQLDDRGRRLVNWLGGILRVADGLDRAHDSAVGWLNASVVDGRLEIRVSVRPYPVHGALTRHAIDVERLALHVEAATRKRDLLERAIGMPVVVRAV